MNGSPAAAATACDARGAGAGALAAATVGALAPATGRVGRAALAPGRGGSTAGVAVGGSTPGPGGWAEAGTGAGFFPARALFGSQLRLRSASAASWPGGRAGTLLTKGTGALVT